MAEGTVDHGGSESYEVEIGLFGFDEIPCWRGGTVLVLRNHMWIT